jgi:HAD superfamily hydrolase (TIGR01509 family)
MPRGVLFDVDGTLVDSNFLHVIAWYRAFRALGHRVHSTRLHQLIGQGSPRLVTSVLGHDDDEVVAAHADFFAASRWELQAFPEVEALLRRTSGAGLQVVLASSASQEDMQHMTDAIGDDLPLDAVTTADDVEAAKPEPDIVQAALDAADLRAEDAVFVGDTVWDVEAAGKAGVECVALLAGGIAESLLRDAGAVEVYADAADLLAHFDDSALGRLARR